MSKESQNCILTVNELCCTLIIPQESCYEMLKQKTKATTVCRHFSGNGTGDKCSVQNYLNDPETTVHVTLQCSLAGVYLAPWKLKFIDGIACDEARVVI